MKQWILAAVVFGSLYPLLLTAQTLELSNTGQLLDGIAAVVNDGVVLKSELQAEMERIIAGLRKQGTQLPPRRAIEKQVLERLINQRIQLQRAKRVGIVISDETLNATLTRIAEQNGGTLAELPELLAKENIDYPLYRETIRNQLTLEFLQRRDVMSRIGVTAQELEEYQTRQAGQSMMNQDFKVSHILVAVPSQASDEVIAEARKKIDTIYQRLEEGADFAKLAVTFSDAQGALEGGSLGWKKGRELPTLFAEVVPDLKPGEVSEPIRSGSGFHIVRLDDTRGTEPIMEQQTLLRHILIEPDEVLDDAAAEQKLLEIQEQILNGDDFEAVAKAVSEDPSTAVDGGSLGWTGPGMFVPEFQEVCDSLKIGELSKPFKTRYGWHIVEVLDRRVHDTTEEVERENAMMAIRNSKLGEETEMWMLQLRDQAFVEYRM